MRHGAWIGLFLLAGLGLAAARPLRADWSATGTFRYEDRLQDRLGFTGEIVEAPIRIADVEILDNQTSVVLGTGSTDSTGAFSVVVFDSEVREVVARVKTTTNSISSSRLSVGEWGTGDPYALESRAVLGHDPNEDVDFGATVGTWDGAGQPFNMFDTMLNVLIFVHAMDGGWPGSYPDFRGWWSEDANQGQAYYINGRIHIGDDMIYDDTVIQHESGHWTNAAFSRDNNPGGTHYINVCEQNPLLAYGEGIASWYSDATREYLGLGPEPQVHVVTTGQPGSGNLSFSYEVEGPTYYCAGPEHEITVNGVLWDMVDGPDTPDATPGVDDDPMNVDYGAMWDVIANYIPLPQWERVSLEDFWESWFLAGYDDHDDMVEVWGYWDMEYYPDALEPDDDMTAATPLTLQERLQHHTFYPEGDEDWVALSIVPNAGMRVMGQNIVPETLPDITVYENDGVTVVGTNEGDIRHNPSAPVEFTPTGPGPYYARVKQFDGLSIWIVNGNADLELRVMEAPPESAQIAVSPSFLVQTLDVGDVARASFVISNEGGGPLHFDNGDRARFGEDPADLAWLVEDPPDGVVAVGDSAVVSVMMDGAALSPDTTYNALIVVSSNDLVDPEEEIIVLLTTRPAVGIGDDGLVNPGLPRVFSLSQNVPNPFNPSTTIAFDIPAGRTGGVPTRLEIYDVRGRRVRTLIDSREVPGSYRVHWDGRDDAGRTVGSGVYLYRIEAGSFTSVRKMVIVR